MTVCDSKRKIKIVHIDIWGRLVRRRFFTIHNWEAYVMMPVCLYWSRLKFTASINTWRFLLITASHGEPRYINSFIRYGKSCGCRVSLRTTSDAHTSWFYWTCFSGSLDAHAVLCSCFTSPKMRLTQLLYLYSQVAGSGVWYMFVQIICFVRVNVNTFRVENALGWCSRCREWITSFTYYLQVFWLELEQ